MTKEKTPSTAEAEILKNLLWIWYQYGPHRVELSRVIFLDHQCMRAGEDAAELLEEFGLAEDLGREVKITEKGLRLMSIE